MPFQTSPTSERPMRISSQPKELGGSAGPGTNSALAAPTAGGSEGDSEKVYQLLQVRVDVRGV